MSPLEASAIVPGTRLGPYEIVSLLDSGGMASCIARAIRSTFAAPTGAAAVRLGDSLARGLA